MNITNQLISKPINTSKFPKDLVKLKYSLHATERLKERTTGSLILAPQYIRLTKENTIDVKLKKGRVHEATAVIDYKYNVKMYLPIIVTEGLVKTVYFKHVKKKWKPKEDGNIKQEFNPKKGYEEIEQAVSSENIRTERGGEEGIRKNVEYVFGDMGRKKKSRWQSIFRTIRGTFKSISSQF